MEYEKQIFISYSSKDKILMEEILHKIEDMQVHIWKAPECIRAGSNYAREIPKAIRESALFLLFVSASSQKSIWVEKEVDTAVSARVRIIPIQLDDSPLSDMYHFYLNNVQMISYKKNPERAFHELRQQIQEVILEGNRENLTEAGNHDLEQDLREAESSDFIAEEKKSKGEAAGDLVEKSKREIPSRLIKTNELRKNKIPLFCEACGCTALNHITLGIYVCAECGHENYDDYTKIRNYMKEAGPSTVFEISRQTGVSRDRINTYFRERNGNFEERKQNVCKVCGIAISSGNLCRNCENKGKKSSLEEGKRFHIIRNRS